MTPSILPLDTVFECSHERLQNILTFNPASESRDTLKGDGHLLKDVNCGVQFPLSPPLLVEIPEFVTALNIGLAN